MIYNLFSEALQSMGGHKRRSLCVLLVNPGISFIGLLQLSDT